MIDHTVSLALACDSLSGLAQIIGQMVLIGSMTLVEMMYEGMNECAARSSACMPVYIASVHVC